MFHAMLHTLVQYFGLVENVRQYLVIKGTGLQKYTYEYGHCVYDRLLSHLQARWSDMFDSGDIWILPVAQYSTNYEMRLIVHI